MIFTVEDPGWTGSVARFWRRTYGADYVGFILLVVGVLMIQFFVEPFHRMFSLDDRSISYPHAIVQRVSAGQLVIYAGGGPLLFFVLWAVVFRPGFHKTHVTFLSFLISLFLTSLLTDIIKNAVGRPRPDLIARCQASPGTPTNELVTIDVCTEQNHHTLHDGWRSFPSGHSSFAFSGLGFVAFFLAGQLHIFRPGTDLTRTLIFFAPLVGAALIAMSRLADYRHDVYDVTAGSLLGFLIANFSYRRYFRPLRHPKCHEPYPNPSEFDKGSKDEERQVQNAEEYELEGMEDEDETVPFHANR